MQRTTRSTVNQPNKTPLSQTNRKTVNQAGRSSSQSNTGNDVNSVTCRKCKSQQIVANKRGYSFSNMFKTLGWMGLLPLILVIVGTVGAYLFMQNASGGSGIGGETDVFIFIGIICWISISLSLPVSILVGFVGRSEIVNGCMNCGFKWRPSKQK
ncbi:hypothetical protein SAMN04488601_11714 [Paenibacillus sp. 453mf]|nr:hypothetical protein SAMN04488601_11714 [Paenibacillus sp. 453mf]